MPLTGKKVPLLFFPMKTPREILEYCGDDAAIASALGVSVDRVDRARRGATLPAAWLDALEMMARRPLPRDAFSFKRAERGAA